MHNNYRQHLFKGRDTQQPPSQLYTAVVLSVSVMNTLYNNPVQIYIINFTILLYATYIKLIHFWVCIYRYTCIYILYIKSNPGLFLKYTGFLTQMYAIQFCVTVISLNIVVIYMVIS